MKDDPTPANTPYFETGCPHMGERGGTCFACSPPWEQGPLPPASPGPPDWTSAKPLPAGGAWHRGKEVVLPARLALDDLDDGPKANLARIAADALAVARGGRG